jgi:hypothetical protein
MRGHADETPRLIDTLRPRERSVTLPPDPPRRRRSARPLLFVAAAAAAAALLGVGFHYALASSAASAREAGILQVRLNADVSAATVFVDGVERGTAPLTLGTLSPGNHQVRVVAEGFSELVEEVEVAACATTIVAARLAAHGSAPTPAAEHEEADEVVVATGDEHHGAVMAEDLRQPSPELTARERARLEAEEARRAREERWERLQAYRARQARRSLADSERQAVVVGVGRGDGGAVAVDDVDGAIQETPARPTRNVGAQQNVVDETALAAHRPEVERVVVAERTDGVGLSGE